MALVGTVAQPMIQHTLFSFDSNIILTDTKSKSSVQALAVYVETFN